MFLAYTEISRVRFNSRSVASQMEAIGRILRGHTGEGRGEVVMDLSEDGTLTMTCSGHPQGLNGLRPLAAEATNAAQSQILRIGSATMYFVFQRAQARNDRDNPAGSSLVLTFHAIEDGAQ